jgi:hypothetical protein
MVLHVDWLRYEAPNATKAEGIMIDGSMDGAPLRSFLRFTHYPNMQNEVIFKSKDSCISQKAPHLWNLDKIWSL